MLNWNPNWPAGFKRVEFKSMIDEICVYAQDTEFQVLTAAGKSSM